MSAMPDLRLQATPEVKSKAKPPAKSPEPSKNEPSSFSKVYAKERQAQTVERAASGAKSASERTSSQDGEAAAASDPAADQATLAASGNSLPADTEPTDEALDPLLAMALGGQPVPTEEATLPDEATSSNEAVAEVLGTLGTASSTPAEDAESDLTQEEAEPVAVLQLPEETDTKAQVAPDVSAKSTGASSSGDFAAAMAAMGAKPTEGEEGGETTTLELPAEELAKEALDSLKDSVQPNRPDQFVSKLNALTQALNNQAGVAQRVPLVPGQPVAMQQGGWSEAVVDRVMWLSSQNLKSAEIQLDPADLGRLEVRVNLSQEQAQVTFASPNASVRDALEGQMHRLRELFAQQGMNLADANVSDQSMNRGWQGQERGEGGRGGAAGGDGLLAGEELSSGSHQEIRGAGLSTGRGLVDYYA